MDAGAAAWKNDGVEIIAEIKAIAPLPRMLRSPTQSLCGDTAKSQVARNTNLRASGYSASASQSSTAVTMTGSALYWIGICRCGRQRAFKSRTSMQAIDVGINGFGRIG